MSTSLAIHPLDALEAGDQTWLAENSYAAHFQNGVAVYAKKTVYRYDDV
jgi:hypothetical protein